MSQDVVQWLNEIKALQQEVSELKQALTEADQRIQDWQNRYEVEAQQRRQDREQQERAIAALTQEIAQLKAAPQLALAEADDLVNQQIDALVNLADLKAKLAEVWLARDRVLESLQQEQAAHQRTRQDLTMALADAMDTLKQLREKT